MDINQQLIEIDKLRTAFKDNLTKILSGIEMLDAIILENQIYDFNEGLLSEIDNNGLAKKELKIFGDDKFTYIVSRMNEKNQIKSEITNLVDRYVAERIKIANS